MIEGKTVPPNKSSSRRTLWLVALLIAVIVSCYGFVWHGLATDHSPPDRPAASAPPDPGPEPPAAPEGTAPAPPSPDPGPQVWVNTKTGVYHRPGSRWYGATAEGQYMGQGAADAAGYHAAANGQ